jgi:hypothetical protein
VQPPDDSFYVPDVEDYYTGNDRTQRAKQLRLA